MEFESNYPNKSLGDKEKTREKTREKIIDLIKEDATITTQELAEILEITPKGVEWQIQKLKKEGILSRVGAKKGGVNGSCCRVLFSTHYKTKPA